MLLLLLVLLPLVGALALLFDKKRAWNIPLLTCSLVLALAIFGLKPVFGGGYNQLHTEPAGPFAPVLQADPLTAIFVILAALLWFAVAIYAPSTWYMKGRSSSLNWSPCSPIRLFWASF